jgi:phage-related protein
VRAFPADARESIGFQLERAQRGLEPRDWKPMSSVGTGVREIRVHAGNEYRVIYWAQMRDEVHVLHAFVKKSQKTKQADLDLARQRFLALAARRTSL